MLQCDILILCVESQGIDKHNIRYVECKFQFKTLHTLALIRRNPGVFPKAKTKMSHTTSLIDM